MGKRGRARWGAALQERLDGWKRAVAEREQQREAEKQAQRDAVAARKRELNEQAAAGFVGVEAC